MWHVANNNTLLRVFAIVREGDDKQLPNKAALQVDLNSRHSFGAMTTELVYRDVSKVA